MIRLRIMPMIKKSYYWIYCKNINVKNLFYSIIFYLKNTEAISSNLGFPFQQMEVGNSL